LCLLARPRGAFGMAGHAGQRVEQHHVEAVRVETCRDLRTRRKRYVALGRRPAGQDADPDFPSLHHSPTSSTSGTSFTLNRFATSPCTRVMSALTSLAVAPFAFTMKLASFSLTTAPPIARPLRPPASLRPPATP